MNTTGDNSHPCLKARFKDELRQLAAPFVDTLSRFMKQIQFFTKSLILPRPGETVREPFCWDVYY